MTETPARRDYRDTVFLPQTDFPMKAGLAAKEPGILARWEAEDLYGQLRAARAGRPRFILHDGPPYANGDIHMGHAMNKILKDIIVRSQSLAGKDAPYIPGWDCHGLPIEWKIEEQYRAKKQNKDDVPAAEFRAECRAYAAHWVDVQREQFKRLGVMGDWDDPYLTMKFESEARIVAELLKFAESGQLYRGAKPVMWSPVEKTALAEAEVEYEDVVSTQIDVAFEITSAPDHPEIQEALQRGRPVYAPIWTTTPWTIPVNQAIAFNPENDYILWSPGGDGYRPADPLGLNDWVERLRKESGVWPTYVIAYRRDYDFKIRTFGGHHEGQSPPFKGSRLAGAIARHPMHHLGGFYARPRPFLPGDFVTTDQGTGLVHMAPDHGEDDFLLCKAHGIDPVFAVEGDGRYRADWAWLGGQGSVINKKFNAPDGPICADLSAAGALLAASEDFAHSYPHSWRSKAKVIFRATPQWFIPMDEPTPSPLAGEGQPARSDGRERGVASSLPSPVAADAAPPSPARGEGNGETLRALALDAIARTRWVPPRSENRITAMVEQRPDWVLSRQRAWGVPIALYANRDGDYLRDPAVNARIIAAFKAGGADAWFTADHAALLGPDHNLADGGGLSPNGDCPQTPHTGTVPMRGQSPDESRGLSPNGDCPQTPHTGTVPSRGQSLGWAPVTDILDVWFDSGSTHAFVIEQRYGPDARADLYVEGSDQHRGWFQSSLLESCGTRGRAPYAAVLTHGFALDDKGRKMSKSLGNVVDPLRIIGESGADILRLWVASTDYFEDVRIGKEILSGASDSYRKLRNTFRYLLGALSDFDESERVGGLPRGLSPNGDCPQSPETPQTPPAGTVPIRGQSRESLPELERYMLHLLATLDAELREHTANFAFNPYMRALTNFAQDDLSAFFFDIRKDSLYCDAPTSEKRRAYRTVLDTLFHALVRYAAPILCFTAEEVWGTRFPDRGSVHLLEWPNVDESWIDSGLAQRWERIRVLRRMVTSNIESMRQAKMVGSSLEVTVECALEDEQDRLLIQSVPFDEICLVAEVQVTDQLRPGMVTISEAGRSGIATGRTSNAKCGRCWRLLPEVPEDGALCPRCASVVG